MQGTRVIAPQDAEQSDDAIGRAAASSHHRQLFSAVSLPIEVQLHVEGSRRYAGAPFSTIDEHTHIKIRRYTSTRYFQPGQHVACVSLSNIEVHPDSRRRGHARQTLRTLRKACSDNNAVLVVENVVSSHMHTLCEQLGGAALFGSRAGVKGCNYWLPPTKGSAWEDFAVAA